MSQINIWNKQKSLCCFYFNPESLHVLVQPASVALPFLESIGLEHESLVFQYTQLAFYVNLYRAVSYPDRPMTAQYRFT